MKIVKSNRFSAGARAERTGHRWWRGPAAVSTLILSGCGSAPSINLLGSFFPGWMLCMILGVVGTLLLRQIFIKANLDPYLRPQALIYLCLWLLIMLGLWLPFFRS